MRIVVNCGGLPGTTVSWVPDPKVSCQPEPEETLWCAQQQKPEGRGQLWQSTEYRAGDYFVNQAYITAGLGLIWSNQTAYLQIINKAFFFFTIPPAFRKSCLLLSAQSSKHQTYAFNTQRGRALSDFRDQINVHIFSSKKTHKSRTENIFFSTTVGITRSHHQETAQILESSLDWVHRI